MNYQKFPIQFTQHSVIQPNQIINFVHADRGKNYQNHQFINQGINRFDHPQLPPNPKGNRIETNPFNQVVSNTITNHPPITFNLHSPVRAKVKRSGSPNADKLNKKDIFNQMESENFKNYKNTFQFTAKPPPMVRTPNKISGQFRTLTSQPFLQEINKIQRRESDFSSQLGDNHSENSNYHKLENIIQRQYNFPKKVNNETSHADCLIKYDKLQRQNKFLLEQIESKKLYNALFQDQIQQLRKQIEVLKEGQRQMRKQLDQKNKLRQSRKQQQSNNKQLLWIKQQNTKLLEQVQQMERQISGKNDLNKFLERKSNQYIQNYEKVNLQFNQFKQQQKQNDLIASILRKEVEDLEIQVKNLRKKISIFKEQNQNLNQRMQTQSRLLQEQRKCTDKLRTQNDVLAMKIQILQDKYEQQGQMSSTLEIIRKEYDQLATKYHQKQKHILDYEGKIATLQLERETFKRHALEEIKSIKLAHQQEVFLVKNQIQTVQKETILNKIEIKKLEDNNKKLTTIINEKDQNLHELNSSFQQKDECFRTLDTYFNQKLALIDQLNCNLIIREKQNSKLFQQLQQKKNENITLRLKIQQSSSTLQSKLSQLESTRQISQKMESSLRSTTQNYSNAKFQLNKQSEQLNQVKYLLSVKRNQCESLKAEQNKNFSQHQNLIEEYGKLKKSFDELQNQHSLLISKNSHYQNSNSELKENYQQTKLKYEDLMKQYDANQSVNAKRHKQLQQLVKQNQQKNINSLNQKNKIELQYNTVLKQSKLNEIQLINYENQLKVISKQLFDCKESLLVKQKYLHNYLLEIEGLKEKMILQQDSIQDYQKRCQSTMNFMTSNKQLLEQIQLYKSENIFLQKKVTEYKLQQQKYHYQAQKNQQQSIKMKDNENKYLNSISQLNTKLSNADKQLFEIRRCKQNDKKQYQVKVDQYQEKLFALTAEYQTIAKQNEQKSIQIKQLLQSKKQKLVKYAGKQILSSRQLTQQKSSDSCVKERQVCSSNALSNEVSYIQIDREGMMYLCSLLEVDTKSGNILNKIVGKTQKNIEDLQYFKKISYNYHELLDIFEIEQADNCQELMLNEINGFKENLTIVLERLREGEQKNELLKLQHLKTIRNKDQLNIIFKKALSQYQQIEILNGELNQHILRLTAKLSNQKIQIRQAIKIALEKENSTNISSIIEHPESTRLHTKITNIEAQINGKLLVLVGQSSESEKQN